MKYEIGEMSFYVIIIAVIKSTQKAQLKRYPCTSE